MKRQASIDEWDWQVRGSCRGTDVSVFYSPDGERGKSRTARVDTAKRICRPCPVRAKCRDFALKTGEPFGVWGGMSEEERHAAISRAARRHRNAA
ncbi:WhiB family transcriptional regulator [Nocardia brasiliensis]|uniref:WhiB family transcriptional regulator n=1 Tax=Nocardia brasiliensis TaxID=37326 RepID=UPI002457B4D7|nr:WhiB family transcriptional regulator [Nocardia brasiliensis]